MKNGSENFTQRVELLFFLMLTFMTTDDKFIASERIDMKCDERASVR